MDRARACCYSCNARQPLVIRCQVGNSLQSGCSPSSWQSPRSFHFGTTRAAARCAGRDTLVPAYRAYLRYPAAHALARSRPDRAYAAYSAPQDADRAALVRGDRPGRHRAGGALLARVRPAAPGPPLVYRAVGLAQRRDEHALPQRAAARAAAGRMAARLRHRAAHRLDDPDRWTGKSFCILHPCAGVGRGDFAAVALYAAARRVRARDVDLDCLFLLAAAVVERAADGISIALHLRDLG